MDEPLYRQVQVSTFWTGGNGADTVFVSDRTAGQAIGDT
jgi:hypothetical protein